MTKLTCANNCVSHNIEGDEEIHGGSMGKISSKCGLEAQRNMGGFVRRKKTIKLLNKFND